MKKFTFTFTMIGFFYILAIILWRTSGSIFYLLNFFLIGSFIGLGMGLWAVLPDKKKYIGRLISQILMSGYLFFGLGCGLIYITFGYIVPENLQIEGFWLWLFSGIFMAAVIHYFVAKIFGPIIFGRSWCGWACWTASVLDLLPWKKSAGRLDKKFEYIRYVHFTVSLAIGLFVAYILKQTFLDHTGMVEIRPQNLPNILGVHIYASIFQIPEFWWFIIGNIFYFSSGITLAFLLKDNRAFCKYLCPIVVFMKPGARISLVRIKEVADGCNECGLCEKNCPMNIKITAYTKDHKRVGCTECILCQTCINSCPKKVLGLSLGFDLSKDDKITRLSDRAVHAP